MSSFGSVGFSSVLGALESYSGLVRMSESNRWLYDYMLYNSVNGWKEYVTVCLIFKHLEHMSDRCIVDISRYSGYFCLHIT